MIQLPRYQLLVDIQASIEEDDDMDAKAEMGLKSPLFVIMLLAENLKMWDGVEDFHQSVSAEEEAFMILKYVLFIF